MHRILGKVVTDGKGTYTIVFKLNDNMIWVGTNAEGLKFHYFNKVYKFVDEADQKLWDEIYSPIRAKELLKSDEEEKKLNPIDDLAEMYKMIEEQKHQQKQLEKQHIIWTNNTSNPKWSMK